MRSAQPQNFSSDEKERCGQRKQRRLEIRQIEQAARNVPRTLKQHFGGQLVGARASICNELARYGVLGRPAILLDNWPTDEFEYRLRRASRDQAIVQKAVDLAARWGLVELDTLNGQAVLTLSQSSRQATASSYS